jgi:hypothetical protein
LDPWTWKAKKILGVGGNGVSLGQHHGTYPNMPKHMTIKQSKDAEA